MPMVEIEQRPVDASVLLQPRVGERVDALAERGVAVKRRVGDGFVELRALLAGEIAGRRLAGAELGLQCRDEAPAIGGQPRREIVEMKRLGEEHAFDRFRIDARRRQRVGARAVEQQVVVRLEFGGRLLAARRPAAACRRCAASSIALARNTTRCDNAFCALASVSSASSRCCAAIICCSRMKDAIAIAAMIRSAIQYALLISEDQLFGAVVRRVAATLFSWAAGCVHVLTPDLGRKAVNSGQRPGSRATARWQSETMVIGCFASARAHLCDLRQ